MTSWVALLSLFALPTAFAANAEIVAGEIDALSRNVPAIVATNRVPGSVISAETAAGVYAERAYGRNGATARESAAARGRFERLRAAGAEFRIANDGSLRIEEGSASYEVVFERER